KYRTLGETPRPYVYLPLSQSYDPKMTLIVRTTGEPKAITPIVREQIRALNANLPIADVQTLREQLELTLLPSRIAAWTLGSFGALALVLAGIGIYGVVSYGAAQRTREIGVRMALGAKEKDVLRLVLGDGLIVIGAGLAIGLLLAAAATRVIASFLYGVGATDPLTFIAVPLLLGGVALLASYIPARRAVKVDPLVALRYE
ncbi:MAG TPA: FtsX-like permease family protein, partial [Pyrinomonadaceae bacterium]